MSRRSLAALSGAAVLILGLVSAGPAAASTLRPAALPPAAQSLVTQYQQLEHQSGRAFFNEHGYLPVDGVANFYKAKIAALKTVVSHNPRAYETTKATLHAPSSPAQPTIGPSWQGVNQSGIAPPDPNGAIGPSSYIETVNLEVGLYNRDGTPITQFPFSALAGQAQLSDPMILWDPNTQRFYYNILNITTDGMAWGFSKDANPQSASDFCNYQATFGYPAGSIADYPKLGQTTNFLLVGINYYPNFSAQHATESDLLWMQKPQGSAPITTCPSPSSFQTGKFTNLRNQDGSQAFTPVPAIQTDASQYGIVVTMSDIECPDICGTGHYMTVNIVRPNPKNPSVPQLLPPHSVKVPGYTPPPDAPEAGSSNTLDTLDGRIDHAVSGFDPRVNATTVWVAHTVTGGAGSAIRWYEINPLPFAHPSVVQGGAIQNPSLFVFNAGISNDRTVNTSGSAHGDTMILGFTTSSSSTDPADQMVEKVGSSPVSPFVMVQASTVPYNDFTCSPVCRWGDYGGATPDPAASLTNAHGQVWLSQEWDTGANWQTWNWEALP